jgi:hypothetical protein
MGIHPTIEDLLSRIGKGVALSAPDPSQLNLELVS